MATTVAASRRQTITSGPCKGVRNTKDPLDDVPDMWQDATNLYIPDPLGGSGTYARRGFRFCNPGGLLAGRGQAVYTFVAFTGEVINFVVAGGHLYRVNSALTVFTDVTPSSGVVIDADATHVYFTTFNGSLIVSDGVNPPWIMGNNLSTPVTGTYIDFDGSDTPWAAFGQPTVYGGSLFFIMDNLNGTLARSTIAWSAPGDPSIGYQQAPIYDFVWTLEQTGSHPIYAIVGTELGLYYFRDSSIGLITGIPGPDLQASHTDDAVSDAIGTLSSALIRRFGQTIYFGDSLGRPYMLPMGGRPIPIWYNLRAVVSDSASQYPDHTMDVAVSAFEPTQNLYLAAIWSSVAGESEPPIEMQAFDAKSGIYDGRWSILSGVDIEAMGILNDIEGAGVLVVLGNRPALGDRVTVLSTQDDYILTTEDDDELALINPDTVLGSGCVWAMDAFIDAGVAILLEDGTDLLLEDGLQLLTETTLPSYLDDETLPNLSVTTQRLGYSADNAWNVDQATIITQSTSPVQVTVTTPTTLLTVEGTPSPSPSLDGTDRLVCGLYAQGRGVVIKVEPTEADEQWILQSVNVRGTPAPATIYDA